jgi:hypothetical protein
LLLIHSRDPALAPKPSLVLTTLAATASGQTDSGTRIDQRSSNSAPHVSRHNLPAGLPSVKSRFIGGRPNMRDGNIATDAHGAVMCAGSTRKLTGGSTPNSEPRTVSRHVLISELVVKPRFRVIATTDARVRGRRRQETGGGLCFDMAGGYSTSSPCFCYKCGHIREDAT